VLAGSDVVHRCRTRTTREASSIVVGGRAVVAGYAVPTAGNDGAKAVDLRPVSGSLSSCDHSD
jgi:hypothetical protein